MLPPGYPWVSLKKEANLVQPYIWFKESLIKILVYGFGLYYKTKKGFLKKNTKPV